MDSTGKPRALACPADRGLAFLIFEMSVNISTHSEGVNHGFEPKIDLPSADDLCHVLHLVSRNQETGVGRGMYARIIRLKYSNFDSLILEIPLCLRKKQRRMIRGGVPFMVSLSTSVRIFYAKRMSSQPTNWLRM
jgi:hypothetical protein